MKQARIVSLALLFALTAAACGERTEPAPSPTAHVRQEDAAFWSGRLFADSLEKQELPTPDRVLHSFDELVYALDYLAFYRIGQRVWFEVDPQYAETFFNPYQEYHRAYQHSDLADVYPCQLEDSYYSRYRAVGIKYSISRDMAANPPQEADGYPVVPSFDYAARGTEVLGLPEAEGEAIPCENGEQLYYLVMNGYAPAPIPGSMAERLYAAAREVLSRIIREDMSDFEKIKAVYDYLTHQVRYDRETAYSADTYLVGEQAYYLEGVFLNHLAVCDGKAKAAALLLNLLGIPCVRETGASEGGDHAWNYVEIGGKWYTFCSTYGQANVGALERVLPNYSMLLASHDTPYAQTDWSYQPQKHPEIAQRVERIPYPVYEVMGSLQGVDLTVESMEEVRELLDTVAGRTEREYKVEFLYTGGQKETFQAELMDYLETLEGVNAIPIKSEGGQAYQVIYLNGT